MTVTARLNPPVASVDPGQQTTVDVTVLNAGHQVEAYQLDVVGDAAAWASVDPPELSVFPGDEAHARITFAPPRAATTLAGPAVFGVRVAPVESPAQAVVPEGRLDVAAFVDLTPELTPRTARGRRRCRHELAVDNRGNAPVRLALSGGDDDEAVVVTTGPPELVVGPGQAAFAKIRVRSTRRHWRGTPLTHPFRVAAQPDEGTALVVDGTMLEEPVLPPWLGKAVMGVAALAVAAAAVWFALLRPTIDSAAEDAAQKAMNQPLAQVRDQADQASRDAGQAKAAADEAASDTGALGGRLVDRGVLAPGDVTGIGPDGTNANGGGAGGAAPQAGVSPFSQRLDSLAGPGARSTRPFTVEAGKVLSITDVFYENPNGDVGTVTLRVGDTVLFSKGLANYRDRADHFVSPLVVRAGQVLNLDVNCAQPGEGATDNQCSPAIILVGTIAPQPTATN